MYEYLYLGLLPLLMGIATVHLFNRLDNSRFQVRGIVGPYFAALALMFGLFSSLTASDVWQRIGKANTLVCAEVNSLRSLLRLSETLGPNSIEIKNTINDYVKEIQQSEFKDKQDIPATMAVEALNRLYLIAADPAKFNHVSPIQSEFLRSLEQVRSAHLERIELRKTHLSNTKLLIIFIFGLLTQFSIALCHAGNTRASWASVMLFSVAFSAAVTVLTVFENPASFSSMISTSSLADIR
jgi:hypothetical protein